MIEELGTELKDLKIKYDGQKHQIRFENQQRRTKISTYENKIMIVKIILRIKDQFKIGYCERKMPRSSRKS